MVTKVCRNIENQGVYTIQTHFIYAKVYNKIKIDSIIGQEYKN